MYGRGKRVNCLMKRGKDFFVGIDFGKRAVAAIPEIAQPH
jgi:hypothetical protein